MLKKFDIGLCVNVGSFTYLHLTEMGAKVVTIADQSGLVYKKSGLDHQQITQIINNRQQISEYKGGTPILQCSFTGDNALPVCPRLPAGRDRQALHLIIGDV